MSAPRSIALALASILIAQAVGADEAQILKDFQSVRSPAVWILRFGPSSGDPSAPAAADYELFGSRSVAERHLLAKAESSQLLRILADPNSNARLFAQSQGQLGGILGCVGSEFGLQIQSGRYDLRLYGSLRCRTLAVVGIPSEDYRLTEAAAEELGRIIAVVSPALARDLERAKAGAK